MQLKYKLLTNILFRHKYFSHQRLECLKVQPSQKAMVYLQNNGLIFKPYNDGFTLFYETSEKEEQDTLNNINLLDIQLRFYLTLTDPFFFNYTEIGKIDIASSFFYFTNITLTNLKASTPDVLHQQEFASENDIISDQDHNEEYFRNPFAVIDINISNKLLTEYKITFKEKQTYWRYILMSEHLRELHNPAILNEHIKFSGPQKAILPNKSEAIYFESDQPISLFQTQPNQFKLVENYENEISLYRSVIKHLPTPNINLISSIGIASNNMLSNISEIFIY